jgi:tRNA A-37 threonylcarbamoyl transferase component Bud32
LVALSGAVATGGRLGGAENGESKLALDEDRVNLVLEPVVGKASWQRMHRDTGQRREEGRKGGSLGWGGIVHGDNHRERLVLFINLGLEAIEDSCGDKGLR